MKRLFTFIACLLLASTAFAGYPEAYRGDPLPDGCIEVEAWVTGWHDRNPWGQPDPTGLHFLFGTLCVDGGVAVLDLPGLARRYCKEAPWGTPGNPQICQALPIGEWPAGRHVFALDNGVYISGIWSEDADGKPVYLFDALTYDANTGTSKWVQGAWWLDAMWYVDDDRYTRITWEVQPRQAEYVMRRVTARNAP